MKEILVTRQDLVKEVLKDLKTDGLEYDKWWLDTSD